MFMGLGISEKN